MKSSDSQMWMQIVARLFFWVDFDVRWKENNFWWLRKKGKRKILPSAQKLNFIIAAELAVKLTKLISSEPFLIFSSANQPKKILYKWWNERLSKIEFQLFWFSEFHPISFSQFHIRCFQFDVHHQSISRGNVFSRRKRI